MRGAIPRTAATTWSLVVVGFAALACAVTWPLAANLRTHLLGDPRGYGRVGVEYLDLSA